MNNKQHQFFQKQYKKRLFGLNVIARNNINSAINMTNNKLNIMMAKNIRGMTPQDSEKEIRRLQLINNGLGFSLPEKNRIEQLIYAKGRQNLVQPSLGISESIQKLGDILKPTKLLLPFEKKQYQFLIDLANKQIEANFIDQHIIIVDTNKNIHDTILFNKLAFVLQLDDEQARQLIKRVYINNRAIILYDSTLTGEHSQELIKINKIAGLGTFSDDDIITLLTGGDGNTPTTTTQTISPIDRIATNVGDIITEIKNFKAELKEIMGKDKFKGVDINQVLGSDNDDNEEIEEIKETIEEAIDSDKPTSTENIQKKIKKIVENSDPGDIQKVEVAISDIKSNVNKTNNEILDKIEESQEKTKGEEVDDIIIPETETFLGIYTYNNSTVKDIYTNKYNYIKSRYDGYKEKDTKMKPFNSILEKYFNIYKNNIKDVSYDNADIYNKGMSEPISSFRQKGKKDKKLSKIYKVIMNFVKTNIITWKSNKLKE